MPNYKSNVSDHELQYISETDKAIIDEDHEAFWLPKSQISYEEKNYKRHQIIKVTIPEWLADKCDLLSGVIAFILGICMCFYLIGYH